MTAPCPIKLCAVIDMYSENPQTGQQKYRICRSIRLTCKTYNIYNLKFVDKQIVAQE
jgi:hypothetical protein